MKTFNIIILLILMSAPTWGQKEEAAYRYKFDKHLEYSKELISLGDFKTAFNNLLELYQIDSTNQELNYYLAFASFYANRDKTIALPYFIKGKEFNGNAYYFLGLIYHQTEDFSKAKDAFNQYKNALIEEKLFSSIEVQQQIDKINTAKGLMKNKLHILVENMGEQVNSAYPDYAPVIFANGNQFYFTSRRVSHTPDIKDPNNEYFEDIYFCERINNQWQTPKNIGTPINSDTHDACLSISSQEDTLYIYRTSENLIGGDILFSHKTNDQWSQPLSFASSINTKEGSESSVSFDPNGNKIYFASNRDGGYGGKDLYFVQKLPNGEWSLPSNLGGMINTEQDEDGPFISNNGTTLYFSSKGHENMGSYDLFKSELLENGQWTEPQNLGYPINSVKDDIFLTTINNEDYFFSSNRAGGFGFTDLYRTYIPKKKNEYLIIKGRIIDHEFQISLKANITVFNQSNNKIEGIYKSDAQTGKFIMALKPGESYKMFVESNGYYNKTEIINLTHEISLDDVLKTIRLTQIKQTTEDTTDE